MQIPPQLAGWAPPMKFALGLGQAVLGNKVLRVFDHVYFYQTAGFSQQVVAFGAQVHQVQGLAGIAGHTLYGIESLHRRTRMALGSHTSSSNNKYHSAEAEFGDHIVQAVMPKGFVLEPWRTFS